MLRLEQIVHPGDIISRPYTDRFITRRFHFFKQFRKSALLGSGIYVYTTLVKNSAVPYSFTQFLRYGERSDGDNATYLRVPLITLLEITLDDGVKTSGDIVQLHESHTVTVKLGFNAKVIPKRLLEVIIFAMVFGLKAEVKAIAENAVSISGLLLCQFWFAYTVVWFQQPVDHLRLGFNILIPNILLKFYGHCRRYRQRQRLVLKFLHILQCAEVRPWCIQVYEDKLHFLLERILRRRERFKETESGLLRKLDLHLVSEFDLIVFNHKVKLTAKRSDRDGDLKLLIRSFANETVPLSVRECLNNLAQWHQFA